MFCFNDFFQDLLDYTNIWRIFLFWRQFQINSVYWCFHEKQCARLRWLRKCLTHFFWREIQINCVYWCFQKKCASFRGLRKRLTHFFWREIHINVVYILLFSRKKCARFRGLRNRLTHFFWNAFRDSRESGQL